MTRESSLNPVRVLNRSDLFREYSEILLRGLGTERSAAFLAGARLEGVITQSSSGSSGRVILRIPRSPADIQDIYFRTLIPYLETFSTPPKRIAMLGGASHLEAAGKFKLRDTEFESFELSELDRLRGYDPDLISCYPSIARELAAEEGIRFPSLQAMKLGGEPLFDCDLSRLRAVFGPIEFFEQLGSTEMPALALGRREPGRARKLSLQRGRFSFLLGPEKDWQRLIVRDSFPGLLFPIGEFYDTGDEVRTDGENILEVRRRNDPARPYEELIRKLLDAGVVNLQIDPGSRQIRVSRLPATMPRKLEHAGEWFELEESPLFRVRPSNKLPFLLAMNNALS